MVNIYLFLVYSKWKLFSATFEEEKNYIYNNKKQEKYSEGFNEKAKAYRDSQTRFFNSVFHTSIRTGGP